MSGGFYILIAGALLLASIVGSKASGRLGVPGLLLFLGVGMLSGSDGPGGIEFSNYLFAQWAGTVALCFILFQGGLSTEWLLVRPVLKKSLSLATLGVLSSTGLMGAFAHFVFGIPWLTALLLGAVVSSTDASAVFTVLKERRLGLRGEITPLLELESGGNDPMAVFLTLGLITLIQKPELSAFSIVPSFFQEMLLGALFGYVLGRVSLWAINKLNLQFEGLYSVMVIALALMIFGAAASVHGSGFLAVYIAGLVLGNADFIHKRSVLDFLDGVSWLMQIAMFLMLGLLVNPHELLPTAGLALACSLFLVFVARPVSVYLSLAASKMPKRDKSMVAWVGLRGAVPIVLATFPLLSGVPGAKILFNVVFFIVLTSVLLQGTTLTAVARLLKVREAIPERPVYPIAYRPTGTGRNDMTEVDVKVGSEADGKRIMDLRLPPGALVILVHRGGEFLVPKGATTLQAGDSVLVLAIGEDLRAVQAKLGAETLLSANRIQTLKLLSLSKEGKA
ncbi:potassium/proton antiporter [Deinococcus psychrotolerans]|uniref:Potassium/proton antiporter n=1 Tax=Deinococcus psychrotolerans TaxID=2489213 RepID=A0A3G8YDG2_9DEIO|nr:potassium/proton antiporter [Deinococcus psychrotolerans]AZI42900.1 potassium/proton antiporter [Deinococcus psychrotolerans]